mmetsp:Transcript_16685/g.21658  ORF Transcript_16685/g.21658 Transcript_16685/m.21658 type:complete len:246 (-) Transcript_16685:313-1050(-)
MKFPGKPRRTSPSAPLTCSWHNSAPPPLASTPSAWPPALVFLRWASPGFQGCSPEGRTTKRRKYRAGLPGSVFLLLALTTSSQSRYQNPGQPQRKQRKTCWSRHRCRWRDIWSVRIVRVGTRITQEKAVYAQVGPWPKGTMRYNFKCLDLSSRGKNHGFPHPIRDCAQVGHLHSRGILTLCPKDDLPITSCLGERAIAYTLLKGNLILLPNNQPFETNLQGTLHIGRSCSTIPANTMKKITAGAA